MSAPDEAARRVQRGDLAAFRVVVEACQARLYRLAVRMTGDADEAEDVVQGAFVRAYQALRDGQWDGRAGVETWLYRICVNTALNVRRERGRRARLMEVRAEAAPPVQEARVEVTRLMALLRELPDEQRAALVLKELEGLTSGEIAELLGCSEGAVEQRLVRARATLRARWTP